jgi:methyl-accepting chemotaxis protein
MQVSNFRISTRMGAGFALIGLVLLAAVGLTQLNLASIDADSRKIVNVRVPTAAASAKMVNNINETLAALRGYMITGKAGFKQQRAVVWADIATISADIDVLSANWTNPANVQAWGKFKATLAEFNVAQDRVENIAHTIDEQPATKVLVRDAAPQAAAMIGSITKMIDIEKQEEATPARKALLATMADFRGSMGLGLANIRAYLLTGNDKFRKEFERFWKINDARFATISENSGLLTQEQSTAFAKLSKARDTFAPLPPKIFSIRGSDKWNMANYLLVAEAAPRAGELLTVLSGAKAGDGTRHGGMVDNQKKLLTDDAATSAAEIANLKLELWILLAVGALVSLAVGYFVARSVTQPIGAITSGMGSLTEGDLEVEITGQDRKDEIGAMAAAFQVFKENLIETKRMQGEIEENRLREDEAREREEQNRSQAETERKQAEAEREVRATEEARQAAVQQEVVQEIGEGLSALVRGDLSHRVVMEMPPEYAQLKQNFNETGNRLSSIVDEISGVVQTINGAANDISSATNDLSARTEN